MVILRNLQELDWLYSWFCKRSGEFLWLVNLIRSTIFCRKSFCTETVWNYILHFAVDSSCFWNNFSHDKGLYEINIWKKSKFFTVVFLLLKVPFMFCTSFFFLFSVAGLWHFFCMLEKQNIERNFFLFYRLWVWRKKWTQNQLLPRVSNTRDLIQLSYALPWTLPNFYWYNRILN